MGRWGRGTPGPTGLSWAPRVAASIGNNSKPPKMDVAETQKQLRRLRQRLTLEPTDCRAGEGAVWLARNWDRRRRRHLTTTNDSPFGFRGSRGTSTRCAGYNYSALSRTLSDSVSALLARGRLHCKRFCGEGRLVLKFNTRVLGTGFTFTFGKYSRSGGVCVSGGGASWFRLWAGQVPQRR